MGKTRLISVLLTCHNRREKTLACFNALFNATLPEGFVLEVFLVDDGSIDGTNEAVKKKYPQVYMIQGNGNLYWNRGMHLAWETAVRTKSHDFYLWLNDDTYLIKDAIEILLTASETKNNEAIIIAPTKSKKNGNCTYSGFDGKGLLISPNGDLQEAETFNGNCVLVPNFIYQRIGTLDPLYPHCIGDIDYGLRARAKKLKCYVAPKYLAYCEGHDTLPIWCLRETPFFKRFKALYSPLGNSQPYYFFRFELRHFGILVAIKHYLSIHLRVIRPKLWK